MKKLRIVVEGKTYEVLVEAMDEPVGTPSAPVVNRPLAAVSTPIAAPAAAPAARAGAAPGEVPSPLAGRVVSLDCKVGDEVAAGAQLLTIEAMKMNTYVNAPTAGKVAAYLVEPGDAVEEGQGLVRLES